MEIHDQVRVIKKLYDNLYSDLRKEYGFTMNEIMFLLYLDKHKKKNTAREIVEDLMITKSHISKSVDSLAKENIIIRIPDQNDKKIIHLFINNKSEDILRVLKEREDFIAKQLIKDISLEDLETFKCVLNKMQKNCNDLLVSYEN